jgi:hypothetical protein
MFEGQGELRKISRLADRGIVGAPSLAYRVAAYAVFKEEDEGGVR